MPGTMNRFENLTEADHFLAEKKTKLNLILEHTENLNREILRKETEEVIRVTTPKAPGPGGRPGKFAELVRSSEFQPHKMFCSTERRKASNRCYKANINLIPECDKDSSKNKTAIKGLNILM